MGIVRSKLDSINMKLLGIILSASLLIGIGMAAPSASLGSEDHSGDHCPEGSRLFLLNPNPDGTCPHSLPTVATPEEENENPCSQEAPVERRQMCAICMEFGQTGARELESNKKITKKCDLSSAENGQPSCTFTVDEDIGPAEGENRWCQPTARQ